MNRRSDARPPAPGDASAPLHLYLPVSFVVLGLVTFAALVILMIGARSPYTHANLNVGYDPRYVRTEQILVGTPADFAGLSPDARLAAADTLTRGASLYVTQGCASCHALEGRGGPVGPRLLGVEQDIIAQRVRQGPVGMPKFSPAGLTDQEISDITAYLRSIAPN